MSTKARKKKKKTKEESETEVFLSKILNLSEKEGHAVKKKTAPGTWHVGSLSGNRLNSGTVRSQFIVFTTEADWEENSQEGKNSLHADQRVFVRKGDDVWDVYTGSTLDSESTKPVLLKQNVCNLENLINESKKEIELLLERSNLKDEFIKWGNVPKDAGGVKAGPETLRKYVGYIESINNPKIQAYGNRGGSAWNGAYEYIMGHQAPKKIFEVQTVAELNQIYGFFYNAHQNRDFNDEENQSDTIGLRVANYEKVRQWFNDPVIKRHACLASALVIYKTFLEWREKQPKPESFLSIKDPLTVALRLFEKKRVERGEDGWFETGRNVNGRMRDYFGALTVDALKAFDVEKITELFCGVKDGAGSTFVTMWSGAPGSGWGHVKEELDDAQGVQKVVDFLVKVKSNPGILAEYWASDFVRPKGFGPSLVTELLMKFHPESCIKHGKRSHTALTTLGLLDSTWETQYSELDYKEVCGVAAKILRRMTELKIARLLNEDGSELEEPADYLTVNEFIYFVDTNADLLRKELVKMSKKVVNASKDLEYGTRKLADAVKNDDLLRRLMAALKTKPFAILAGHSGTGKSRIVRRLAYMTCNVDELKAKENDSAPGNYCMIQVKPNWHDSTDLLGYYSEVASTFHTTPFIEFICKAYAYPNTPFFVCLDEMNLAPVEHYFAEYLSAIESAKIEDGDDGKKIYSTDKLIEEESVAFEDLIIGKNLIEEARVAYNAHRGLIIPKNLFVVGTVNMDETTHQFSRKVLDRAMTLLMDEVNFNNMGKAPDPQNEEPLDEAGITFLLNRSIKGKISSAEAESLNNLNTALANTPFVVGYRFANEYALYRDAIAELDEDEDAKAKALDHMVLMKLLPRIHGEKGEVEELFKGTDGNSPKKIQRKGLINVVKTFAPKTPSDSNDTPADSPADPNADGPTDPNPKSEEDNKKPKLLSVDKMEQILQYSGEYLTFWP